MGKKSKRKQRDVARAGGSDGVGTIKFTAPTSGLEDVYFTLSTAKDAAKFKNTVSKLARHVGTNPWPQSLVAPKAMSILIISPQNLRSRQFLREGTWPIRIA